jgi:tRNA(Ile)-lysidine synthase
MEYPVPVHPLAQSVLAYIRRQELMRAGDRVGVAVSGGIDSVALLRLLFELRSELGIVLSVVHFNHKLRGAESDEDEQFVAALAREHDLEFYVDSDDVAAHAREEGISVEAAARELRYGFLRRLLSAEERPSGAKAQFKSDSYNLSAGSAAPPEGNPQGLKPPAHKSSSLRDAEALLFHGPTTYSATKNAEEQVKIRTLSLQKAQGQGWGNHSRLNKIATGHTLDDQAETVLMRMIRGAGMRGLGGIYPRIPVEDDDGEVRGEIVRPLLAIRRRDLEQYLKDIGQVWREDSSNADPTLTRNRVRKLVMPLLEKEFNPAVAENLAELAEIARGEENYWKNEIAKWIGTKVASVNRMRLLSEPVAVRRRVVKAIGEQAGIPLEFRHVEEILRFAAEDTGSGRELSLPLGWKVRCQHDELVFVTPDLRQPVATQNYEYELPVPGKIVVSETGLQIEVQCISTSAALAYDPDELLDEEFLPGPLRVRNWRPGDRFWPAHTKSPRKIKLLLQERHVALPERRLWPVIVSGEEIVWLRGFPSPAKLRARPGREAIRIVDTHSTKKPEA